MDCKRASTLMMDYIDGTISQEDLMKLMNHIEGCDMCREEFSLLSDTIEIIESIEEVEPPEGIEAMVMEKIDTSLYKKSWRRLTFIGLIILSGMIISGAVILNLWIPWMVGKLPSTGALKEGILTAIIEFVHFIVLTLPRLLVLIKRAFSFILGFSASYLGIATVLLLGLSSIEIYLIKLFKYNWEGKK